MMRTLLSNKFVAIKTLLLFPALVCGSSSLTEWQGHRYGQRNECGPGEALIGVCSSGKNADCRVGQNKFHHATRCARIVSNNFPWHDGDLKEWLSADWRDYNECPPNTFAVGRCASGEDRDCRNGGAVAHELRCAVAPSPRVIIDYAAPPVDICLGYGRFAQCPEGMVITEECGAGEDPDCGSGICGHVGHNVYTGIRCRPLRGYEYGGVQESRVDREAEFLVEDCKKEQITNEGDSPIINEVTNTITVTTNLEEEVEESSSSSTTITNSFDLTRTIGAEVGIPLVEGSVTAETSIGISRSHETTFETSSTYRERLESGREERAEIRRSFEFTPGSWVHVSFGGEVRGFGDYTLLFREYAPGRTTEVLIDESVRLSTSDISGDSYILILNTDNYDHTLITAGCEEVAHLFLSGTGYFRGRSAEELVQNVLQDEGNTVVPTVTPTKRTTAPSRIPTATPTLVPSTTAPTRTPTSTPTLLPTIGPTSTTAPSRIPTDAPTATVSPSSIPTFPPSPSPSSFAPSPSPFVPSPSPSSSSPNLLRTSSEVSTQTTSSATTVLLPATMLIVLGVGASGFLLL